MRARVTDHDGGVTLRFTEPGSLVAFMILWNVLFLGIGGFVLGYNFLYRGGHPLLYLMGVLFLTGGIGGVLILLHFIVAKETLHAGGEGLVLEDRGIGRTDRRVLTREEVHVVRVGSITRVRGGGGKGGGMYRVTLERLIIENDGEPIVLGEGLREVELRYLQHRLIEALQLDPEAAASPGPEVPSPPAAAPPYAELAGASPAKARPVFDPRGGPFLQPGDSRMRVEIDGDTLRVVNPPGFSLGALVVATLLFTFTGGVFAAFLAVLLVADLPWQVIIVIGGFGLPVAAIITWPFLVMWLGALVAPFLRETRAFDRGGELRHTWTLLGIPWRRRYRIDGAARLEIGSGKAIRLELNAVDDDIEGFSLHLVAGNAISLHEIDMLTRCEALWLAQRLHEHLRLDTTRSL